MGGTSEEARIVRKKFARTIDNGNLGGFRGNTRRNIGKLIWMEVDHAARDDHERLTWQRKGMPNRLARLRLGLPRHGAGVDNNKLRILGIDKAKAGTSQIGAYAVTLNAIDAAAKINHRDKRCSHVLPR